MKTFCRNWQKTFHIIIKPKKCKDHSGTEGVISKAADTAEPKPLPIFSFNLYLEIVLLKSISASKAPKAEFGLKGTNFEEAFQLFLKQAPNDILSSGKAPISKTIRDRFTVLIKGCRENLNLNLASSGIYEAHGEYEQLLEDIILEMDHEEDMKRK